MLILLWEFGFKPLRRDELKEKLWVLSDELMDFGMEHRPVKSHLYYVFDQRILIFRKSLEKITLDRYLLVIAYARMLSIKQHLNEYDFARLLAGEPDPVMREKLTALNSKTLAALGAHLVWGGARLPHLELFAASIVASWEIKQEDLAGKLTF
ncbi:MAG TPA: hypothetical protein VFX17_03185 [Patescibacteria group bacterium]|nr:hypothetical protein [Patescibacteria group bacterium]